MFTQEKDGMPEKPEPIRILPCTEHIEIFHNLSFDLLEIYKAVAPGVSYNEIYQGESEVLIDEYVCSINWPSFRSRNMEIKFTRKRKGKRYKLDDDGFRVYEDELFPDFP